MDHSTTSLALLSFQRYAHATVQ